MHIVQKESSKVVLTKILIMKKNGADIIRSLFSQNKGLKADQFGKIRTNLEGGNEDRFGKRRTNLGNKLGVKRVIWNTSLRLEVNLRKKEHRRKEMMKTLRVKMS